jgi:gag-polypeptide of LTR copia-type
VISKVTNCESAYDIWQTLASEYGNSSAIMLRVLERQLPTIIKQDDTSMANHIDNYSKLVDEINYHTKPSKKWNHERINRTFFGTLDQNQWGAYEDGLGDAINDIPPSELYSRITARDTVRNPKPTVAPPINKQANCSGQNLGSRISGSDNKQRHGGRRGGKRGKQQFHPYSQKKCPSREYIAKMKQQYGDDYIECRYCH